MSRLPAARIWLATLAAAGMVVLAVAVRPATVWAAGSPTATTLTSSQDPAPACSPVSFTATVFGALFPDSPEGAVTFFDNGVFMGVEVITPDFDPDPVFGKHVIPTNHSSGTLTATLSGGTHLITTSYFGTDLFSPGGPLVQTITAATSNTTLDTSVDPSTFGQTVEFTAGVSSACSGGVAGSVQFTADGSPLGGPQSVGTSGQVSVSTSTLAVGSHDIEATFSSTDPDVAGSSASLTNLLRPAGQLVTPAATTTIVASSADPSEFGAPVTFTAATTVDPPGAGSPTGTVQFQDDGADLGPPQALDATGHVSYTTSSLSVGSHTITATYTSDGPDFVGSTGNLTQVVGKARTTLVYDGQTTADFHDPAILSARLTRTDDGAPISGKPIDFTMAAESCAGSTATDGAAVCAIVPSEAGGAYTVSAGFGGDGDYLAAAVNQPFTVTREETATLLTGPTVILQGHPVTLGARLLEDGIVPISARTLTLTLGTGTASQSCTTGLTDAGGNASCTIGTVAVALGPEPVQASFDGDPYYLPSTASASVIVFAFPTRGVFVVGNQTVAGGASSLTFWGAQWAQRNSVTGGAPSSFKGFGDGLSSATPVCGGTWTASPGNSGSPVASLPSYMGVAVTSSVSQSGSTIRGNIVSIIVVVPDPGYGPDPGHAGTGIVVATYC